MAVIKLSAAQQSALECAGLDTPDNIEEFTLSVAWQGDRLSFRADEVEALWIALRDLSNDEDGFAQDTANDAEMRKFAARAARALGTVAGKVIRA